MWCQNQKSMVLVLPNKREWSARIQCFRWCRTHHKSSKNRHLECISLKRTKTWNQPLFQQSVLFWLVLSADSADHVPVLETRDQGNNSQLFFTTKQIQQFIPTRGVVFRWQSKRQMAFCWQCDCCDPLPLKKIVSQKEKNIARCDVHRSDRDPPFWAPDSSAKKTKLTHGGKPRAHLDWVHFCSLTYSHRHSLGPSKQPFGHPEIFEVQMFPGGSLWNFQGSEGISFGGAESQGEPHCTEWACFLGTRARAKIHLRSFFAGFWSRTGRDFRENVPFQFCFLRMFCKATVTHNLTVRHLSTTTPCKHFIRDWRKARQKPKCSFLKMSSMSMLQNYPHCKNRAITVKREGNCRHCVLQSTSDEPHAFSWFCVPLSLIRREKAEKIQFFNPSLLSVCVVLLWLIWIWQISCAPKKLEVFEPESTIPQIFLHRDWPICSRCDRRHSAAAAKQYLWQ